MDSGYNSLCLLSAALIHIYHSYAGIPRHFSGAHRKKIERGKWSLYPSVFVWMGFIRCGQPVSHISMHEPSVLVIFLYYWLNLFKIQI